MTAPVAPWTPPWTPVPDAFWDGISRLITPYVICSFIVPGKPQSKERRIGSGRFARTPPATREAEARVLKAFQDAHPDWLPEPDGTYGVMIEFDTEAGSRSDLDNLTKLVWDALNKKLWLDDVQVGMALLRLTRGNDPNSIVRVFGMNNNGTPLTSLCECGTRFRSVSKPMCDVCIKRRKAVNDLLRDEVDEQTAAENARLRRRVFSYITACSIGDGRSPSVRNIAEQLGVPESKARAAVDGLIAAGNIQRLPNRQLKILKALGAAA